MMFLESIGGLLRTTNTSRHGSPRRHRSLRFESLEQRALLDAATAGDFQTLKNLAESGRDYEITLTANISVGARDTIRIGSEGSGNVSILGAGHTISTSRTRSTALFSVSDCSLTISNLTIDGFANNRGNGAIFNQTGGTTVINSGTTISNCSARRGGVAYLTGGTITVGSDADDDTTVMFSGNSASNGGGVFYYAGEGSLTVNHGTFQENTASNGGVIYLGDGSTAEINGGTFTSNSATSSGGVFRVTGSTVVISGGTISNNTVTGQTGTGGVVHSDGTVTISGGTITGNSAYRGGVVCTDSWYAYVTISGGTITGNSADRGGVVYTDSLYTSVTISGGTITGNSADRGGVVYTNSWYSPVIINGGTITDNSADRGGVVYTTGSYASVTVGGGTFSRNSAVRGGVFFVTQGSTATVNSGTFGGTGETAQNEGNTAAYGGVLYVLGSTADINDGVFAGNTASENGGVCYTTNHDTTVGSSGDGDATVNIGGGSFTRNTAYIGGALYVNYDSSSSTYSSIVNLAAVTMEYNSAANGGAIANHGGTVNDMDSSAVKTFTGNSGRYNTGTEEEPVYVGNGGAIFNSGVITLSNTVFSANSSAGNGGAVNNLAGGTLTLTGAAFSDNTALSESVSVDNVDWADLDADAGDGGALQNWGTVTLIDAYFTGNSAHDGGAIANGEGAVLTMSQTTASTGKAPLGFSGNGAVYGGAIINVGTLTREAEEDTTIEFTGNLSYNNGGAISNSDNDGTVQTGSLDLYGASFTGNTAGSVALEHVGYGGAIISAKPMAISGTSFSENSANSGKGGAIDQVAGTLSLTDTTFTDNSTTNTGFGGAVNTWVGGSITDCEFTGNSAKYGGAVSVLGNDAATTITTTGFSENSAASYGGAIYASGTVEIDGATISGNTASLGGGVLAITSNISSAQKGRGKVTFTGTATTFSDNTATKTAGGKHVGNDICASSSNSAAGNGAVIEIETVPTFSGSTGYDIAIDRSILVLASGAALPQSINVYSNKEFTCGYAYDGSTLEFTSLTSTSGINKWWIYWSGSAQGEYTEYTAGGTVLPSGAVDSGTVVLIKGFRDNNEMNYYLIPTVNAQASGASEALLDESLFDTQVFEGLLQEDSALEEYCDECFL